MRRESRCARDGGIIDDGTTAGPKYGRDFVLHRQQHTTDVDVADLMKVLDRLLGGEQTKLALGAGVVERDWLSVPGQGTPLKFDKIHRVQSGKTATANSEK